MVKRLLFLFCAFSMVFGFGGVLAVVPNESGESMQPAVKTCVSHVNYDVHEVWDYLHIYDLMASPTEFICVSPSGGVYDLEAFMRGGDLDYVRIFEMSDYGMDLVYDFDGPSVSETVNLKPAIHYFVEIDGNAMGAFVFELTFVEYNFSDYVVFDFNLVYILFDGPKAFVCVPEYSGIYELEVFIRGAGDLYSVRIFDTSSIGVDMVYDFAGPSVLETVSLTADVPYIIVIDGIGGALVFDLTLI